MTEDKAFRNFLIGVVAYVLIAIFTFGYAAAHHVPSCVGGVAKCGATVREQQSMGGMMSAIVWPLYWSWEAWA